MRFEVWNSHLALPGLALAAAALLGAAGTAPYWRAQRPAEAGDGVTHLRLTGQAIVPEVTRLGMNLGEQNFYDSGQMVRNLLYRNPGFEGMEYRSILHCVTGGAAGCVDPRQGIQWPAGFWDGAGFEVLDGAAEGRRGKVTASGPSGGGYGLTLKGAGTAIGAGDWLAVEKKFPGDAAAGWWPTLEGGARLEAERTDLSPETQGRQALRIEADGAGQSVDLRSYFDTTQGFTFVRLRGRYRLSFRAKGLAGNRVLHVHVRRDAAGMHDYLEQDLRLTSSWADYHADFAANEDAGPVGAVEAGFTVTGRLAAAGRRGAGANRRRPRQPDRLSR